MDVAVTLYKKERKFRALCDPKGHTPCCFYNRCMNKNVSECVCEECYDIRQDAHAEYSTWVPSHPACPYRVFSSQEACDLLTGSTHHFVGDSLVRHVYTALLLVIAGDMDYGAINDSVSEDIKQSCKGLHMFSEKTCRLHLRYKTKACNGTANLEMKYYTHSTDGIKIEQESQSLAGRKSIVFFGIGVHDDFKVNLICRNYGSPLVMQLKKMRAVWPRVIWMDAHAPGLFKSPFYYKQSASSVEKFNFQMEPCLTKLEVPILRTFSLTDGMSSFDGEHYGRGINLIKANIFLSYLKELRSSGKW